MRFRNKMFATVAAAAATAMMSSAALAQDATKADTCTELMQKYASENAKSPVVYRSVLQGKRAAIYRDRMLQARKMAEAGDAKGCVDTIEKLRVEFQGYMKTDKDVADAAWKNASMNRVKSAVPYTKLGNDFITVDNAPGRAVYSLDGQPVGVVDEMVEVGGKRYFLVSKTGFMGATTEYRVVPVTVVGVHKDEGSVILPLKASQYTTTESVESAKYLTTQEAGDWLNKNNGYYQSVSAFGQ